MDEIKEELREETNASGTPAVKRRSRKSKSAVGAPTEAIEANGSISEAQGQASGTSRRKKRASVATETIAVAALETPDEPVKEKKRRKSTKAKQAAGELGDEACQNEVNIPEGQGKVQRVRVQVNGRKSKSASCNTRMCVRAVPEEIPFTMGTESPEMQPLTNQVRVEAVETTQLPFRAIKVRNVVGKVVDLTAEVICNKVIVQGKVHEQLYFVATDGIVHHLADDVPFSTFIDIPGAQPGMSAHVTGNIEEILTEVAPNGLSIIKKIIIEIFVKVTETVQVNLLQGHGPIVLLDEVVGENTKQTLVENDFDLGFPALKIDEIVGRIQRLEAEVIKDKIIIQGILHKQIFFIGVDNIGRHQGEDVPFSLFIDLPGAEPGMDVQLHPRIEGIFYELFSETILHQKAIIEFFVKVTETIRHPVTVGHGPLFKVEEFIGENTKQELSETLIELPFAAEKVREIEAKIVDLNSHVICDKVIVQGTIHKQIFYISAIDNVERHLAEDIPFSLFLDIPGAVAGDLVRIQPIIEAVFFELESATDLRQKVVIAIHAVVAREVQLNLVLCTGPLYKVEQVVGEGTKQELIVRREAIVSPTPPIPPTLPITINEITIVFPNIAAASQQIILRNEVALPMKAIKVKEILAQILDARYHIIEDGLIVEGIVEKVVVYVGTDNVVHTLTEEVPFSILVSIPGIVPNQPVDVNVEIENISFELNACGDSVVQVIVLKASVSSRNSSGQRVTVVTNVAGPGVVQEKVRVRAMVENNATGVIETREFDVVTEVTAPGIAGTEKQTLLLDVVGDGNPNPVPVRVVTRVILR